MFSLSWLQSVSWKSIKGGLQFPCSVGCVSSGSQRHQLARRFFCLSVHRSQVFRDFSFGQFPFILFLHLFFFFLGPVILFVFHFVRISQWFYSHRHLLHTEGPNCFDHFSDLSSVLPNLLPLSYGFSFLAKRITLTTKTLVITIVLCSVLRIKTVKSIRTFFPQLRNLCDFILRLSCVFLCCHTSEAISCKNLSGFIITKHSFDILPPIGRVSQCGIMHQTPHSS